MTTKIKRLHVFRADDIPEDWRSHLLVLWEEDDALTPDRERPDQAFWRFTGRDWHTCPACLAEFDEGDTITQIYRGGWVLFYCCGLGSVGVLVS